MLLMTGPFLPHLNFGVLFVELLFQSRPWRACLYHGHDLSEI